MKENGSGSSAVWIVTGIIDTQIWSISQKNKQPAISISKIEIEQTIWYTYIM